MCAPRKPWAERYASPEARASHARTNANRRQVVRTWLIAYKRERGCIDCGYHGHESGCDLDLDHTDGKTASIPHLRSIAAVQAEIERHACVVRCANCHRIKTWKEKRHDRAHAPSPMAP